MAAPKNKLIDLEKMDEVIADLSKPISLQKTLLNHEVSAHGFFATLKAYPLYAEKYAHAQSVRADLFADQIIELADSDENPNKVRNQIDARKWSTGKMKPSVYGDRIDLNVNQTIDIVGALTEAKGRMREALKIPIAQLAESTDIIQHNALGSEPNVEVEKQTPTLNSMLDLDDES